MSSSLLDLPRGTVTLLFTDIEGSTYLLQQLGDCYTLVLAECRQLLRAVFQQWSGHEIDTQGDAFFVAFARATDAVSATVDTQRILANHSWPEGVAVRIRMGLHTGEPSLTSEGYVGLDVHRAARIMSAAHGGQVLLSQTTCNLVEQDLPEDVFLRDLGEHRLKDLGRPRRLFQLVISDLPADFPPLKTLDTHPNNLPVQSTPFIGREQEVIAVQHLLSREDVRLLTLTGPGGTGKTRLGVQVAAEASDYFADGMFFVDLAPINDPALVVPTVAQTLSIREVGGQTLLERVKEELQQKQILLLLDNFEQVVVAAPQVADLLAACPQLKVVVTSREVLHVQAEHEFAVPPLALPDPKRLSDLAVISQYAAIALFIQRAQAVKSDFQLTNANARAVMEICARLDGLPLAIELAAARMKLLTPQALLTRLSQRFAVLTGGARDIPIRQQTLRNTIEWSYNLLDAREQRLFRRISVFVSGCTLEAIEAVCVALDDGSGSVLDGVASLIDKNMLYQTGQEGEAPRLMMLETLREYGLERLTMSGEVGMTQRSHAKHYLALAEEAELQFEGPQQVVWLARLEKEYDNLRAALQWFLQQGDAEQSQEMALQLGSALSAFSAIRGFWSETRAFLEQSLAGSEGVAAAMRAKALDLAAGVAFAQGDLARAEALAQESLALCREFGDTPGIARSFRRLAEVASSRGNVAMARLHSEEALTRWREVDDKEEIAALLASLVILDSKQGKYDRALTLLEENVLMYREQGNKVSLSRSLFPLAEILFDSQGDPTRVRLLVEEALSLCRELGDKDGIAYCFRLSGQLALSQGDVAVACSLAEKGLAMHRELEDRRGTAQSLSLLARTATLQGDHAAARALYEESLAIGKSMNAKELIAPCLEGLAGVVAAQGEPSWTARLWAAAEALREAMGVPIPPVYRAQYEQSIAAARSQLGEKLFASAWAEGRSMTLDQLLIAPAPTTMPASTSIAPASAPLARKPAPYPDGLTAREVEVLRLVADGLTDTQVAAQLVISPATVNTHLKAIYGKIGVSSRGAATRYAMERHLI